MIYNAIITTPPEPDKLPQMKGRLDRPGQNSETLKMHYYIVGDTIEEALIFRLEMAQKAVNEYIMPLAQFYEIAFKY